ncbi:MAG: nuclear transport factor 2 family protein [Candidatus Competibacter sp.]|nr:nuclear transport factor 2 family protein [Candidatus Competibacter sp.]MDG4583594.1 nuclear transport factor 2 family protein [Candidatus Competibacter sp.]
MSNIQTVQNIYAAFGRGDIPAILECLEENVIWEYDKVDSEIPWLEPRQGRTEVAKFFEALLAVEFQTFQPKHLLESGNIVVSLNDVAFVVKATGKTVIEEDEIHIWHFGARGQVVKFCHKTDTHRHWLALREV